MAEVEVITGVFSISNDRTKIVSAGWECQLCNTKLKIKLDDSYLQFEDRVCPKCKKEFDVRSYRVYSN